MPAPGKTKLIKFPPTRAGKDVKWLGYAGGAGGMFKFRFDQYIMPTQLKVLCMSDNQYTCPIIDQSVEQLILRFARHLPLSRLLWNESVYY